jgi:hypothetical protein
LIARKQFLIGARHQSLDRRNRKKTEAMHHEQS